MKKLKILNIVGARPNFIKVAPLHRKMLESNSIEPILIHTGQHYDQNMSKVFFEELGMPIPDEYLNVGSGSHAIQTAKIMVEFEKCLDKYKPDFVLVVGDVNSTLACAITAKKKHIQVIHYEAGLRSNDKRMPEEINRLATDAITDLFFTSEEDANIHLKNEGHLQDEIIPVGNLMIDTLVNNLEKSNTLKYYSNFETLPKEYVIVTLHRPENVDDLNNAKILVDILTEISQKLKVIFPIHPRTTKVFESFELLSKLENNDNIYLSEPIGYLEFLNLVANCKFVLTDSGGIQEETTYLKIPCITLRKSTERPSTTKIGSNTLIPEMNLDKVMKTVNDIILDNYKSSTIPKYWDGKAAERIVRYLESLNT